MYKKSIVFLLFLIFILILPLIFSACSRSTGPTDKNILMDRTGNYETTASITYKDLQATAQISRETPRSCSVMFTSPKSLADMSFIFYEDAVDLAYKGLSFSFNPGSVPGGAAAKIAVELINRSMRDDGVSVDYSAGILTLSGIMESGEFSLRLDRENGNLLTLSVPAEDLEIEFINFRFLD